MYPNGYRKADTSIIKLKFVDIPTLFDMLTIIWLYSQYAEMVMFRSEVETCDYKRIIKIPIGFLTRFKEPPKHQSDIGC